MINHEISKNLIQWHSWIASPNILAWAKRFKDAEEELQVNKEVLIINKLLQWKVKYELTQAAAGSIEWNSCDSPWWGQTTKRASFHDYQSHSCKRWSV